MDRSAADPTGMTLLKKSFWIKKHLKSAEKHGVDLRYLLVDVTKEFEDTIERNPGSLPEKAPKGRREARRGPTVFAGGCY